MLFLSGTSLSVPALTGADGQSQILGGVASISRVQSPAVVTHYNIEPTPDLYANVQGRDLGGVARDVQKVLDDRWSSAVWKKRRTGSSE